MNSLFNGQLCLRQCKSFGNESERLPVFVGNGNHNAVFHVVSGVSHGERARLVSAHPQPGESGQHPLVHAKVVRPVVLNRARRLTGHPLLLPFSQTFPQTFHVKRPLNANASFGCECEYPLL